MTILSKFRVRTPDRYQHWSWFLQYWPRLKIRTSVSHILFCLLSILLLLGAVNIILLIMLIETTVQNSCAFFCWSFVKTMLHFFTSFPKLFFAKIFSNFVVMKRGKFVIASWRRTTFDTWNQPWNLCWTRNLWQTVLRLEHCSLAYV